MSILIKGMDKPKSCDSCRCICSRWNGDETIWRCGLLVGEDYETTDRDELYKDCPLVEIPKHGRLIDADTLQIAIDKYEKIHGLLKYDFTASAPTIIEGDTE